MDWRRWKRWPKTSDTLALTSHQVPDSSPEAQSLCWLLQRRDEGKKRQGLWLPGLVIRFLSSAAVRSCGRQSLALAAETNEGSGFHRGGCREDTQSCDGSLGMQPGMQPGSRAPAAFRCHHLLGTDIFPGSFDCHVCAPGRKQEAQEAKEGLLSKCSPKNLLQS